MRSISDFITAVDSSLPSFFFFACTLISDVYPYNNQQPTSFELEETILAIPQTIIYPRGLVLYEIKELWVLIDIFYRSWLHQDFSFICRDLFLNDL